MAPHSSTLAWKIPWTEEPGTPDVFMVDVENVASGQLVEEFHVVKTGGLEVGDSESGQAWDQTNFRASS